MTGVMDAYMDSIPMLFCTGQVPSSTIGNDMFQEMDAIGATMSMTKHSYILTDVATIPKIFAEAFWITQTGRPGPVHIDIPKDISNAIFPGGKEALFAAYAERNALFSQKKQTWDIRTEDVDSFFALLAQSKKPILLVWQGVKHAGAEHEINEFIAKTHIPTVITLLAKGIVSPSKHFLGCLGMHGYYHANMAMDQADLIINVWSRFDDRIVGNYQDFAANAKVIHIDIDKAELGKVVKTDLAIHTDAKDFLQKILTSTHIQQKNISDWQSQIQSRNSEHPFVSHSTLFWMKTVFQTINDFTAAARQNYIFVTDVGQHQMRAWQTMQVYASTHWLSSGGSGTMGFCLPAAIGAAFAYPTATIIGIVGDGGFQMNIQELQTIQDHALNIKIFVMNNRFLGMVRQWQDLFFDKNYAATPMTCPDIMKIADAYGIWWCRISTEKELQENIATIFSSAGPLLIECVVEKEENVFPMVPAGKPLSATIVA